MALLFHSIRVSIKYHLVDLMRFNRFISLFLTLLVLPILSLAQQTNPVERQVSNPITDTPNINPISPEQRVTAPKLKKKPGFDQEGGDGELVVYSDKQSVEGGKGKRIVRHTGNVDVHYGLYRLKATEITIS